MNENEMQSINENNHRGDQDEPLAEKSAENPQSVGEKHTEALNTTEEGTLPKNPAAEPLPERLLTDLPAKDTTPMSKKQKKELIEKCQIAIQREMLATSAFLNTGHLSESARRLIDKVPGAARPVATITAGYRQSALNRAAMFGSDFRRDKMAAKRRGASKKTPETS